MKSVLLIFTSVLSLAVFAKSAPTKGSNPSRGPASILNANAELVANGEITKVYFFKKVVEGKTYACFFTENVFSGSSTTPGQLQCLAH